MFLSLLLAARFRTDSGSVKHLVTIRLTCAGEAKAGTEGAPTTDGTSEWV